MKKRTVKGVVFSEDVNMGPITLKQPLPLGNLQQVDPFLLLHHVGPKTQAPGGKNIMGIGAHPHRGFEPVTFIFSGDIHHKDSQGNDSIIRGGGVQWMTAGSGIVHSESASENFVQKGGELELIQLWVNLPANKKMHVPQYQGFQRDDIPAYEDGTARLNVIAGVFRGLEGPVQSLTGVTAYTIEMKAGDTIEFNDPTDRNAILYQLKGSAEVNGSNSAQYAMTIFGNEGESIEVSADSDSLFLFVSGAPVHEELAQYGPFVMNSQSELMQAVKDYQAGLMGKI